MDSCCHHQVGTDVALTVTFGKHSFSHWFVTLILAWLSYRLTLQGNFRPLAMAMLMAQSWRDVPATCGNRDGKVTLPHLQP